MNIDQSVRDKLNAKYLYELMLREDIPWRQWNHWIRNHIIIYLKEHNRMNRINHPQQQQQQYMNQQQYIPQNVNIPQQPITTNWNVQPQQMQNFQMVGGQHGNQQQGGIQDDNECLLM